MTEDQRKTFIDSAAQSALKAQGETDARETPESPEHWKPSEALYAFMGWLTTRDEEVTFSSHHTATAAVELIKEFCDRHQLSPPRDQYHRVIVSPNKATSH